MWKAKLAETVIGLAAAGKQLWVLAGPGTARGSHALLKYGY